MLEEKRFDPDAVSKAVLWWVESLNAICGIELFGNYNETVIRVGCFGD